MADTGLNLEAVNRLNPLVCHQFFLYILHSLARKYLKHAHIELAIAFF